MLRWRALHPYNAVHVLRIGAPLDVPRLSAAIGRVLEGEGLSGLALDAAHGRYEYAGGAATVALEVLPAGGDALHAAEEAIERELNAPFPPDGAIDPFRFFAIDAGETFLLGVRLRPLHRRRRFDRRADEGPARRLRRSGPLRAAAPGALPARLRPAARAPCAAAPDRDAGARRDAPELPDAPPARTTAPACRRPTRSSCAPSTPRRSPGRRAWRSSGGSRSTTSCSRCCCRRWPRSPANGSTAGDGRSPSRRSSTCAADFQPPAPIVFGQFLSSFRVTHPMPAGQELAALARDVQAQTRRTKERKLYLQTLIGIAGSGVAWHFMTPEVRASLPRQELPGLGRRDAAQRRRAVARGGRRRRCRTTSAGVPTGPMAPLVLAASTVNGALHLGFSWRVAAFDRETVDNAAARVVAGLRSLAP